MKFPKIGKLRKGGYYVMPIVGNCTLHFPVPDDQGGAKELINQVEEFSLQQQSVEEGNKAHTYKIEVEFEAEPDPPELA